MKKLFAFVVMLVVLVNSYSQQIPKKYVLCEFATGTWCPYCPGAAMGAHDLVTNGHQVAIIKYHGGDPFSIPDGNTRLSYYSSYVEGYPTAIFNGLSSVVGGDHNNSMYNYYIPEYNSAISQTTSFYCNIDTIYSNNDIDFTAKITVKKVANYTGTDIRIYLALTESDIDYSWQGQTKLHYLLRKMLPNGNGTTLDFSVNDSLTFDYNFTVDNSWVLSNLELIAFVQDYSTKEVLQTDKKTNLDLPTSQNDVMLMRIDNPTSSMVFCNNVISPIFTVKNKGTQTLSYFDVYLTINDSIYNTITINDNIASLQSKQITIDQFEFNILQNNTITVLVNNPNGQEDNTMYNNSQSLTFYESKHSTNKVFLDMYTGKWGYQISYSLYNSQNTMVDTSGLLVAYTNHKDTFDLDLNQCYTFKLIDKMNIGFHSSDAYCLLYDKFTDTLFYVAGSFGKIVEFIFKPTQQSPAKFDEKYTKIEVYPNPSSDFVNIQLPNSNKYTISLYSTNGQIVYQFEAKNIEQFKLDISELAKGVYLLNIKDNSSMFSKKIIKL